MAQGEDRPSLSTVMETTTSANYEAQKWCSMLRLSNLRKGCGVEGIMGDMFAIGIKAEEVDKSLAIVESMKTASMSAGP